MTWTMMMQVETSKGCSVLDVTKGDVSAFCCWKNWGRRVHSPPVLLPRNLYPSSDFRQGQLAFWGGNYLTIKVLALHTSAQHL